MTFTHETASGWQQAQFATPVAVTAGTAYVASYFTPSRYSVSSAYFATAATTRGPLTALRGGADGANGLYRYTSTAGAFPNASYTGENYWVDVVFQESVQDKTAPSVVDRTPAPDATGVPISTTVSATFDEGLRMGSATVEVRDAANALVAGAVAHDLRNTRVKFTPTTALRSSSTYTVRISGGADGSGNVMAPMSWTFHTAAAPPPPPDRGPGGPIAVVTSSTNPISTYTVEILRAEGMNEFTNIPRNSLTASRLASYSVLILGDVPVTGAQVKAVSAWVADGGNLLLMKPDRRFLALAGLTAESGTVGDGYLAVDASTAPGAGITTDTMQYHGVADRYTLSGATAVAGLYSSATASTGLPAVTWRSVGTNGGQVAVFAYDLARSIVQTRQGNPAWAGQDRNGFTPNQPNELFFGGAPAADWVNPDKVQIPQADEQQRLLDNLIVLMSQDKLPMPRFWYFPDTLKAVVVATGDDHAGGGTAGRFDQYRAASPAGCSVALWQCARFTSYVYPGSPLTNAQATSYDAQGFEIGLQPQNNCTNYSSLAQLEGTYSRDLSAWRSKYTGIASPRTSRFHCLVWSDWASQPRAELANGIRLDTNYYPGSWLNSRPGFMTGSGIPMRFTNTNGTLLDVYQASTVMSDESGQTYPFTANSLLDGALGPLGYYGVFTANMPTDQANTFEDTQLLASAQSRDVPLITARQLLTWLDGRDGSSFSGLSWSAGTMTFSVNVGTGAARLTGMLPTTGPGGRVLSTITRSGTGVAFTRMTVKGQEYAMFPALGGSYQASYAAPSGTLTLSTATPTAVDRGTTAVTWSSSDASTSAVELGTKPDVMRSQALVADRTTQHRVEVGGLAPSTAYYFRVRSVRSDGSTGTWPATGLPPATFRTPAVDRARPVVRGVRTLSLPDGTARVSWTTDEPASSRVDFGRTRTGLTANRLDDTLVRRHTIVLTGLAAHAVRWLRVSSTDASGNTGRTRQPIRLRTVGPGIAVQTLAQFRTGLTGGAMRVSSSGFGALAVPAAQDGTYVSTVLDARQKVDWRRAVVRATLPPGATLTLSTRRGSAETADDSWSPWQQVGTDARIGGSGRYLQFRFDLSAPAGSKAAVEALGFTHTGKMPQETTEIAR